MHYKASQRKLHPFKRLFYVHILCLRLEVCLLWSEVDKAHPTSYITLCFCESYKWIINYSICQIEIGIIDVNGFEHILERYKCLTFQILLRMYTSNRYTVSHTFAHNQLRTILIVKYTQLPIRRRRHKLHRVITSDFYGFRSRI